LPEDGLGEEASELVERCELVNEGLLISQTDLSKRKKINTNKSRKTKSVVP
jgi:hypothetical protein